MENNMFMEYMKGGGLFGFGCGYAYVHLDVKHSFECTLSLCYILDFINVYVRRVSTEDRIAKVNLITGVEASFVS
jgi:hypothetical protein